MIKKFCETSNTVSLWFHKQNSFNHFRNIILYLNFCIFSYFCLHFLLIFCYFLKITLLINVIVFSSIGCSNKIVLLELFLYRQLNTKWNKDSQIQCTSKVSAQKTSQIHFRKHITRITFPMLWLRPCFQQHNLLLLNRIKTILNDCGIQNVWETQSFINCILLVSFIKLRPRRLYEITSLLRLKYKFVQVRHSLLDNLLKALNYKLFNDYFGKEGYFEVLGNKL